MKPMPKDTDPTLAKGGSQGGGDPRELGLRQDGFLPLLHIADVSLTLPVWGEKAWRVPK